MSFGNWSFSNVKWQSRYPIFRLDKNLRIVKSKYQSVCAETGKQIKVGEECVYCPIRRKVFCMESTQALRLKKEEL